MTDIKTTIVGGGRAHGKSAGLADYVAEQLARKVPAGHEITDIQVDPYAAPGATSITVKTAPRGGARPGSGRKPLPDDERKRSVTISFRVREETRDAIQDLRAKGVDMNDELERLVARLTKRDTKR